MRSGWLLRDGDVVCALEMTDSRGERARGLRGLNHGDGALHLTGARVAHTMGIGFPVDVALLSDDLVVVGLVRLSPWRVALPRKGVRSVVEAEAGALERWGVQVGDQLTIRQVG
jgi:uncharacterized membrane protein (UPF0127 family)